jgi:iron complex transport system substrate-binding protein
LLAPFAAGCAPKADSGKPRVVSVSKQINEFIYAIGAQDVLVGRDLTSIYPPQIKQVPSVGYHRALSAEGIISTKPTLLITDGNVGPESVLEQVRKVGIPVVTLAPGGTVDSAQALLTKLGQQFHR